MLCGRCSKQKPRPENYGQVLDAASSFKSLMHEPKLQAQVLAGLHSFNPDVQRAACGFRFEHFLNDPQISLAGKDRVRESERLRARRLHGGSRQSAIPEEATGRRRWRSLAGPGLPQSPCGALKIKEPLEYPIVVDTVMAAC